MNDILTFLRAIAANPSDESCRLVFADWLEEHGDGRAEFVRLDCALQFLGPDQTGYAEMRSRWAELRLHLSPSWLVVLGRSEIENCEMQFVFQCPRKWEELTPTEVAAVRFCHECRKQVFYCSTIKEAKEHATMEHCVAVDIGIRRYPGDLSHRDSSEEHLLLGLPRML
jgi:uncharacterized protein (TIGR02996 family)